MAWSSGLPLKGTRGAQVIFTDGPPQATDGLDGDAAIDRVNGRLYAQKANGAWPTTFANLAAKDGATIRNGSGAPTSSTTANDGDYYLVTGGSPLGTLYGPRASGAWPSTGVNLVGTAGAPGSVFYFDTVNPGANFASVGDVYLNTSSYELFRKVSTGWQSLGILKGAAGAASTVPGPQGTPGVSPPGLYSGSGAPSTTNPTGTQVSGSYYLRTDVTPALLYGPLNGTTWPTTGISVQGSYFQTTTGAPASTLGQVGDIAIDPTNAFFYPPKTSSGWTAAPINLIGPPGPTGPTSAYRHSVRGMYWVGTGSATAGTNYAIATPIVGGTSASNVPLLEPAIAAGTITAVTATCPGSVAGGTATFNVLKNGTIVYTASAVLTCSTAATATSAVAKPASTISFAANDVLSMSVSFSVSGNQAVNATLFYTLNA